MNMPPMHPGGGSGRPGTIEKPANQRQALLRLLPYLRPYRLRLIFVGFLVVVFTLLGLLGPFLMGVAIDQFIATKDPLGLARIALLMLLVYIVGSAFEAVADWIMAKISQGALKGLRHDLFGRLQELPLVYFDTHPAGELMSRLTNDIEAINQAISLNAIALIASIFSMGGIIVAMFLINAWLALVALVVVPVMFWFTEFVARYTRKGFRDLQRELGGLNAVMEESISGQRVVKAFRRNDAAIAAFREHNDKVYRVGVYANSYALLMMPLTNVLGNFFVIILAGVGGLLALAGLVSVGVIVTFISYARNFVQPFRQLSNMYNQIQAALAGAERVFEIIDAPSELLDDPQALPLEHIRGEVAFDGVCFSYQAGTPIIKNMTLEAKAGETVALVGPTGAGKTTIVSLLTRFYEIDSGKITIDGIDICDIRKSDLRRQLGLVLQDTFLFQASVLDNIRYGRLEAIRRGMHRSREDGGCRPLHRTASPGLPDDPHRTGQQPEPGTAPAVGDCPGDPCRPEHPDPGRGDQQRRHPHRGAHPKGLAEPDEREDQLRDRPPPEHDP